jgi:MinD-like ATPase involved in chromosome partitioning or flagellar assembly
MLPNPPIGTTPASAPRTPNTPSRPTMLLIASGKGGVGTSMIAALAALAAAARGERVLLVDASESGGGLHHLFAVRPTTSIWSLTNTRTPVDDAMIPINDRLTLIAGGANGGGPTPTTDVDRRTAIARLARIYPRFQLVIFDGGSRLDSVTAITELVDPALLLVTSADRLALAANYALVKTVSARRPNALVSVLTNRHGDAVAADACEFLLGACAHFLGRTIDVAGAVPDDPCLLAAVGAGMTVHDAVEGSPAADAVRGIVSRFIPSWPANRPDALAAVSAALPSSRRWS